MNGGSLMHVLTRAMMTMYSRTYTYADALRWMTQVMLLPLVLLSELLGV